MKMECADCGQTTEIQVASDQTLESDHRCQVGIRSDYIPRPILDARDPIAYLKEIEDISAIALDGGRSLTAGETVVIQALAKEALNKAQ